MPQTPVRPAAKPTLAAIITTARAGGLARAETMFREGGYAERTDDAAALAVKGRILKDRAITLPADRRAPLYRAAAQAYGAADALAKQPYTLINLASLTALAGDAAGGEALARKVLAWLDSGETIAETPFYIAATRAEALLLCGDSTGAAAAMELAVAHDPDGWASHARTIQQFTLILDAQGRDLTWLDAFRPPRSLHFCGHLAVAPDSDELAERIAATIEAERIGFGYGALAAGSDIVVAECLLAAGAELHVVLPTDASAFLRVSVEPYAAEWRDRYEACLAAASSIRALTQLDGPYEPLATQLASDIAMGSARSNAHRLESEAIQLVIVDEGVDPFGSGAETARCAQVWNGSGAAQHVVRWNRNAAIPPSGAASVPEGRADLRLTALLHIGFDGFDDLDDATFAEAVDEVLAPLREAASAFPDQPRRVLPAGNARIAAFLDPLSAWRHAAALLALPQGRFPLRLSAHYGIAHWLGDPPALVGRTLSELGHIAAGAIPGVLTTSQTFADALQLAPQPPRVEPVGEVDAIPLFAVHT